MLVDGYWLSVRRNDPRAFALYRRHYSAVKNAKGRAHDTNFLGPGECLVLLSSCGQAAFAWQYNTVERYDGQVGVCCTLFRNESAALSSDMIREADELARRRWPDQSRHFTYVAGDKIRSSNPGFCFLKAGWRNAGHSKRGLTLLERVYQI